MDYQYSDPHVLDYYVRTNPKEVKDRMCLCCQRDFKSRHKFNRMCPKCKEINKSVPFKEAISTQIKYVD